MKNLTRIIVLIAALTTLCVPETAQAYGGPGSVISGIGAFLAAVAALLAALFGFIWFPLKRLYQKMTEQTTDEETAASPSNE
jgi:preprotein translocase subunit SecG